MDGSIEKFYWDFHVGLPVINIIQHQNTHMGSSKNRTREMIENTPSVPEENCWWPWMGPFTCMKKTANVHEWVCSLAWESCQWRWMGPFTCMKKTANELKWAHSLPWENEKMADVSWCPAHSTYLQLTHKSRASYGHALGLLDWQLVSAYDCVGTLE